MLQWRNGEQTMISHTDPETGHVTIVEPGHPKWDEFAAADPSPFVPPPEPDPLEAERAGMRVSRLQARAALLQAGLLDQVDKAVNGGLFGGGADPLLKMAWTEAAEFNRTSPTIAALAGLIGLDDAALDDLFRAAAQIRF